MKFYSSLSQIECGSLFAPPTGCLEYYTGLTGTIKSWNYDDTNSLGTHPADAAYSICIRREKGFCGYSITPADETNSFSFGGGSAWTGRGRNGDGCGGGGGDALNIPQASKTGQGSSQQRFCGTLFNDAYVSSNAAATQYATSAAGHVNSVLTTYQTPFRIFVKFNSKDVQTATDPRRGFKMLWRQIQC